MALAGSKGTRTAGGKSHPRCASGGCSVYRKKGLITSIDMSNVLLGGRVKRAWNKVGRACGTDGT